MFFYQAMAPNFIISFGRSVGDEETIKYCILYIMGLLARVEYIATVSVWEMGSLSSSHDPMAFMKIWGKIQGEENIEEN